MKTLSVVIAVALAASCAVPPAPWGTPEDAVREAAFRHLFANNASGKQQSAAVYFLSVEGADPSAALLARFSGHSPPVRQASRCAPDPDTGVRDEDTGESGLLFSVDDVAFETPDRAVVGTRYYEAGLSAATYRTTLVRRGGEWVVTDHEMLSIS